MSESEKNMTIWLLGGIGAFLAIVMLALFVSWFFRGPRAAKTVASKIVSVGEWFDWSPLTAHGGRHVLWMRLNIAFEGYEDTDAGVRMEMQTDEAPMRRYIWQCDPEPNDFGMSGSWFSHFRTDGTGQATLTCTIWVCGFKPRAPGVPVRLRGRVLGAANMKSGTFELSFARK